VAEEIRTDFEDSPDESDFLIRDHRLVAPSPVREVVDEAVEHPDAVPNVAQCLVAVEAQHPANVTAEVVVIDMLWIRLPTDSAAAILSSQHVINVMLTDPVPAPQVIFPSTPVEPFPCLTAAGVVAVFAIDSAP
jgi:hypothetical protein